MGCGKSAVTKDGQLRSPLGETMIGHRCPHLDYSAADTGPQVSDYEEASIRRVYGDGPFGNPATAGCLPSEASARLAKACLTEVGVKEGMATYLSHVIDPEGDVPMVERIIQTASIFLHGSEEAKAVFIFQSMDFDGNGVLDREELCRTVKLMSWAMGGASSNDSSVHINVWGLADAIMERADEDGNGVLDQREFITHHTFITDALTTINKGIGSSAC